MRAVLLLLVATWLPAQSRVALQAAAARAHTSHDPDPTVRNPDWLADRFLGPDEIALLDNHPIARAVNQDYSIGNLDPDVVAVSRPVLVRTRFIDERFERALRDGVAQVVILNAGLDSRSYLFRALLEGKRVIEIDDAATQALKKRRVIQVLGVLPSNVTYAATLSAGGYRSSEKTFFIWEGAAVHQPEFVVREMLRTIAKAAPGSSLVMDFVWKSLVDKTAHDPAAPQTRCDAAVYGEPWLFGVPDGQSDKFFREVGLEPSEILETNSPEAEKRYLTRRDGSKFGPPPNAPGSGNEEFLGVVCVELTPRSK